MKTLHLILKRRWFDLVAAGVKSVEYREVTPYWRKRLRKTFDVVHFRNGYHRDAPQVTRRWMGCDLQCFYHATGENGEELHGWYYCVHLGEIVP